MPSYGAQLKSLTTSALEQQAKMKQCEHQRRKLAARTKNFLRTIRHEILVASWRGDCLVTRTSLQDWQLHALELDDIRVSSKNIERAKEVNEILQVDLVAKKTTIVNALDDLLPREAHQLDQAQSLSELDAALKKIVRAKVDVAREVAKKTARAKSPPPSQERMRLELAVNFVSRHLDKIDELYGVRLTEKGFANTSQAPRATRAGALREILIGLGGPTLNHADELMLVFSSARRGISLEKAAKDQETPQSVSTREMVRMLTIRARAQAEAQKEQERLKELSRIARLATNALQVIATTRSLAKYIGYDPESLALGYEVDACFELAPAAGSELKKTAVRLLSPTGRLAIKSFHDILAKEAKKGRPSVTFDLQEQPGPILRLRQARSRSRLELPVSQHDLDRILIAEGLHASSESTSDSRTAWTVSWSP